jgi:hypothetical protein
LIATGAGKFSIGVVDTGRNLLPVSNLPRVSTTLVKLVAKFAVGVVDTVNLPPVSLPVVNLELRISPRIFEKI